MFRIENKDVFYKHPEMIAEVHYGKLFVVEPTLEENKYELKKFNLETETYEHSNEQIEMQFGEDFVVSVDGFFFATKEVEATVVSQLDKIEANLDFLVMVNS